MGTEPSLTHALVVLDFANDLDALSFPTQSSRAAATSLIYEKGKDDVHALLYQQSPGHLARTAGQSPRCPASSRLPTAQDTAFSTSVSFGPAGMERIHLG